MPTTQSLSLLDMAFFVLETHDRMSNIGPIAILKPPAGSGGAKRFADKLMREMQERPVGAPFNLVYRPPGLHGLPYLEEVDSVDVAQHCRRITLSGAASDDELFDAVCGLHVERMDRSRPLWEVVVFDGLQGGRVALYAKAHHGTIDGKGFVEVIDRWFTADASDLTARALWEGLPPRPHKRREKPTASAVAIGLAEKAVGAAQSMVSLYSALGRQAMASGKLAQGLPLPFVGTSTALAGRVSANRNFAYCSLPLTQMKAIGKANNASINDVLLTVLDMALHHYLSVHGARGATQTLVADMPVALGGGGGKGGNSIAILQLAMGEAQATPLDRLSQITERTQEVKNYVKQTTTPALVAYTAAVHGVPALLELVGVKRMPTLANLVISNPFGLPERRYLAGAEVEMALPVSVLAPGQVLNVTAATYDQHLQIAFLGTQQTIPDIGALAESTVKALAELAAACDLAPAAPTSVGGDRARRSVASGKTQAARARATPASEPKPGRSTTASAKAGAGEASAVAVATNATNGTNATNATSLRSRHAAGAPPARRPRQSDKAPAPARRRPAARTE